MVAISCTDSGLFGQAADKLCISNEVASEGEQTLLNDFHRCSN